MEDDHVLVVGASGICGRAALEHFASSGIRTTAVARHRPRATYGADFLAVDLLDQAACASALAGLQDVTQIVYAAVYEEPQDIVSSWAGERHGNNNAMMLRNLVDVLDRSSGQSLRNIALVHGGKAYGMHVRPAPLEAREGRDDARDVPNIFYFDQLDYIQAKQAGRPWGWTAVRIGLPIGFSTGGVLNTFSAIMAWGTVLKERGEPLHFPGGQSEGLLFEALDTEILARFFAWAGRSPTARNQVFNLGNGELFSWRNSWPDIAAALGMEVGDYVPMSVAEELTRAANLRAWDAVRARHGLVSPALQDFVGTSAQIIDFNLDREMTIHRGPLIMSGIKRHLAGFHEVIYTDEMFHKWVARYRSERLIPPG